MKVCKKDFIPPKSGCKAYARWGREIKQGFEGRGLCCYVDRQSGPSETPSYGFGLRMLYPVKIAAWCGGVCQRMDVRIHAGRPCQANLISSHTTNKDAYKIAELHRGKDEDPSCKARAVL